MSTLIKPDLTAMTQEELKSLRGQYIESVDANGLSITYLVVRAAADCAKGVPLTWSTDDDGYSVIATSALGQPCVGIANELIDVSVYGTEAYFAAVVRGINIDVLGDGSVADGDVVCTANGSADTARTDTIANAVADLHGHIGVALEADDATTNLFACHVNCKG